MMDYKAAKNYFSEYLNKYPKSNGKLFALSYLKKIAAIEGNTELADELNKEMLTCENHGYIFKSSKELSFISPLGRPHKALYKIDEIIIYVKGESFAQIRY